VLLTHKKLLRNTQETLIIIAEPIQNITASLADAFLNIRSKEVWVVGGVTISRKNGFKNGYLVKIGGMLKYSLMVDLFLKHRMG